MGKVASGGGKKKTKKQDKKAAGVQMTTEETNQLHEAELKTLEREYESQNQLAVDYAATEATLKELLEQAKNGLQVERNTGLAVISDMTRGYKASQETLINSINDLETRLTEEKEKVEVCSQRLREEVELAQANTAEKDTKIAELKKQIEATTSEFSRMLQNILEAMNRNLESRHLETLESRGAPRLVEKLLKYSPKPESITLAPNRCSSSSSSSTSSSACQ